MTDIMTEPFTISGTLSATPEIAITVSTFSQDNSVSVSGTVVPVSVPTFTQANSLSVKYYYLELPLPAFSMSNSMSIAEPDIFTIEYPSIYYVFRLTGAADGLENVTIPITSFQTRMRNAEPTYLQVVIPGLDYADDIYDRSNGRMLIDLAYKEDGVLKLVETIVSADLEDIMLYEGPESDRIVLVGHRTETFTNKELTLTGSNYRNVNNGFIRHRLSEPNVYIRPGDTVNIGGDTFKANVISYYISVDRKTMEVGER